MSAELAAAIVQSLVQGSLYALIGVGFVVLYRSTGVLNFAQGSFMTLGAFASYQLVDGWGLPLVLAVPLTIVALGLAGAGTYQLGFRRLVGAPPFTLVIATLGLSVVLQTITVLVWGPDQRTLPEVLSREPVLEPFGLAVSALDLFCVGLALGLIVILELVLARTRLGARMRAVADAPLLAAHLGIPVGRMSALAWGIGAACAGTAGVAYSVRTTLDPVALQGFGLVAFAGVLLGGMGSIRGALVGGIALAAVQNAAVFVFGGAWTDVVAYAVLFAALLVRPQGLFGSPTVDRI